MAFENLKQSVLVSAKIGESGLKQALSILQKKDVDYSDLYFQKSRHESWVLEDGIVREGNYNVEQGVGVRAVSGEQSGFAYCDSIEMDSLLQICEAASGISRIGGKGQVADFTPQKHPAFYSHVDPLNSIPRPQKIDLLKRADAYARSLEPSITQVTVSLSGVFEEVLVAASDGTLANDVRPLVRFSCSVLAERNGRRERGSSGGGGRHDYNVFFEEQNGLELAMNFVKEAVRQAMVNLEAVDAPAGLMPVVLGSGWPGVLLHEAVGHGLEGDFNRKGSSAFSGKMGKRVASSLCTIVDDGTLQNRRGSLSIDDEGTAGQYNVLIENGILCGYMQDKMNARLMGTKATGNGRRESYAHLPMPRMTNTYMLAGESEHEEIIASVKKGIYAPNFGGGQVDITSGKFVFSASEAYLIEDGKVTAPIKGATLIGNGPEAMQQVSMVGNDLNLDMGVGICGKDGQSVPVGVGQPTLKLDQLTVGGTV
ncbi:metalloprotease TldD [Alginatibacterium sediminis]|uniref:Metalloprotease TldD n=1 Tax=Alginatibacterium sediminis TaxID=2164068 RepID=A0A420EKZ9_9ALTE|nr:metalloprotease TldD [Alginatibacterium sediminis]RKF21359.1 metalloprotease TldD [Alginatibacterium sediminis]